MLLRFFKKWTLPLAMLTGALGYLISAQLSFLEPAQPCIEQTIGVLTPLLIFAQLLLTFCKIETVKELKPKGWHAWLLLFQLLTCVAVVALLLSYSWNSTGRALLEGAMVCLICPTATAAAVITDRLGGSASSLSTYTLLSNLLAAITVPLLFPLVEPHAGITFFAAFLRILSKVFPLLLLPVLLALAFRRYLPRIHAFLLHHSYLAFYLWAVALTIVTGQTVRSLVWSDADAGTEWYIFLISLLLCAVQFFLGKYFGGRQGERISGGQALGQKNTILAIWMSYTYLNPLSSLAPGSYVLWQNIFNSWQLYRKEKREQS
jgi:BASS family bile acid:Na+ symporter